DVYKETVAQDRCPALLQGSPDTHAQRGLRRCQVKDQEMHCHVVEITTACSVCDVFTRKESDEFQQCIAEKSKRRPAQRQARR
ncbi:hypothetical protein, partial [Klebsiella pneumoniae]|uniref:hypothetical protein n=1 Tax=Klebsiella pneumoniae TaxID=573 RepID=UPI001C6082C3